MKYLAIIPARYGSSRFPGKPLAMIDGTSMIMRVYNQVKKATCVEDVIVATDDDRILKHVEGEGGKAVMTSPDHRSGTDRVNEAAMAILDKKDLKTYVVINVQGDEPYIDPRAIDSLAGCFEEEGIDIATLMKKIGSDEELFDENTVKVIHGKGKRALYFSRSALPFVRGKDAARWRTAFSFFKHIGIYAYRADILSEISRLKASVLEEAENLEQLRWIENGYSIHVEETDYESLSVDTPEDLSKITNRS